MPFLPLVNYLGVGVEQVQSWTLHQQSPPFPPRRRPPIKDLDPTLDRGMGQHQSKTEVDYSAQTFLTQSYQALVHIYGGRKEGVQINPSLQSYLILQ